MEIQYRQSYSTRKSAYVEAFNKTIQDLIAREAAGDGENINVKWFQYLDRSLYKYNMINEHSFLRMTPYEAEQSHNQNKVRDRFRRKHQRVKYKPAKFRVGDKVRIHLDKGRFGRSYQQDFSNEVFEIEAVLINLPHARYRIKDANNETILGNFTEDELTLFSPT